MAVATETRTNSQIQADVQVRESVRELLAGKMPPEKTDELARLFSEGIQARIVLVIAQLALARKVIVADLFAIPATSIAALAALALVLAVAYRLTREAEGNEDGRHVPAS